MKKNIIVLLIIIASSCVFSQQWRKVASGSFPNLNQIHFTDENTGFCAGFYGTIIKTTDGGLNWSYQITNTLNELSSIFFLNSSKGFAVGTKRTILSTQDGGANWHLDSLIIIPDPKAAIKRIYFEDENNGWVIASTSVQGWILHTSDGGVNWIIDYITDGQLYDLKIFSGKYGIVTGKKLDDIYYSADGINWIKSNKPEIPTNSIRYNLYSGFILNENFMYIVGWGSIAEAIPTVFIKSTDGGINWTYYDQPPVFDYLFDVYFKDEFHGIAVGGGSSKGSTIAVTSDGGLTWNKNFAAMGPPVNSISSTVEKIWICGDNGLIACSQDFGLTWEFRSPIPSSTLYVIKLLSDEKYLAAGFDGALLKSINGGETWDGAYINNGAASLNTNDLFFLNENTGFAVHSYRMISKTTDGGNSWSVLLPNTNDALCKNNSIWFLDENTGFVVGQNSATSDIIYKTTDGGATWNYQENITGNEFKTIVFNDDKNGIIVGKKLSILRTTNAGVTWSISVINNIPVEKYNSTLQDVEYVNSNLVYACGEGMLLRSTDGGAVWEFLNIQVKSTLYGICFYDETTGYAVGDNNILQTKDAGYSWTNIIDSTVTGILYDVAVDETGLVWICGANGNIYTNKEKPSGISDDYLLKDFCVFQNYPNPFNPSTTIKYAIPESGNILIKIYDIIGREVTTLINEFQYAGNHQVNFSAGGLSSGFYLFTVKYKGQTVSFKMCLIK